MRRGLLLVTIAVFPMFSSAETYCYQVYQATRFNCYEYSDPVYGYMGRCESYNVYDVECWYAADDPIVIDPPFIDDHVPSVMDPAFLYIARIDDSDPANVVVEASAASYLDSFALTYNGQPYGTAYGSGTVRISGVPAQDLGPTGTFWVQACSYLYGCAAGQTTTWTSPGQKTASGSVTGWYLEGGPALRGKLYDRTLTVKYDTRGYGVAWGPGNTRHTFHEAIAGFSYDFVRDKPTFRSEELRWRVDPGMSLGESCTMTEVFSQDNLEKPGMHTSMHACGTRGAIGSSGMFTASIGQIFEQTLAGLDFADSLTNRDLTVTVP